MRTAAHLHWINNQEIISAYKCSHIWRRYFCKCRKKRTYVRFKPNLPVDRIYRNVSLSLPLQSVSFYFKLGENSNFSLTYPNLLRFLIGFSFSFLELVSSVLPDPRNTKKGYKTIKEYYTSSPHFSRKVIPGDWLHFSGTSFGETDSPALLRVPPFEAVYF